MIEKEEQFQLSNTCWICERLIDDDDEKVRDHCHITGNFRGPPHWSCNINYQLTKKIPVIFHNLRGSGSHLIFSELNKFIQNIHGIFLKINTQFLLTVCSLCILALKNWLQTCQTMITNTQEVAVLKNLVLKI